MAMTFNETNWPPRSPHEALLSSPSGRKKLSQRHIRRSASSSPSPVKRRPKLGSPEVEEDEETLKLQLKRIEAKLKLKKLQAQSQSIGYSGNLNRAGVDTSQSRIRASSGVSSTVHTKGTEGGDRSRPPSKSNTLLEVPVSPPRKHIVTEQPRSPGRVLLGIDKGLKGRDVSLRRAPYLNSKQQSPRSSNHNQRRTPYIAAAEMQTKTKTFSERMAELRANTNVEKKRGDELQMNRSKAFNVDRKELEELKKKADTHPTTSTSEQSRNTRTQEREFSREEILRSHNKPTGGLIHRETTASGVRNTRVRDMKVPISSRTTSKQDSPTLPEPSYRRSTISSDCGESTTKATTSSSTTSKTTSPEPPHRRPTKTRERDKKVATSSRATSKPTSPTLLEPSYRRSTLASEARKSPPATTSSKAAEQTPAEPASEFDKYSGLHLSKRILPEALLARTLQGKKILRIPDLLRDDGATDTDTDIVVMGIIASKSTPREHKDAHKTTHPTTSTTDGPQRSKYMALTLTDLKWDLTLYLFGPAFTRFWKLTPGTLVAILNPSLMPPRPPTATDPAPHLALALSSSDDTVLELGVARDLAYCASRRRDGSPCPAHLDARHTAHCAFHVDRQLDRTRAARMEVNSIPTAVGRAANGGGGGGGRGRFFGTKRGGAATGTTGLRREGPQYDRGTASRYFVAGRSAAALLDEGDGGERVGGAERLRVRLAAREREREVARRLGAAGGGVGGEYLSRVAGTDALEGGREEEEAPPPRVDAWSLGLVRKGAGGVRLSPVRKRRGSVGLREGMGRKRKRGRWVGAGGGDGEEEDVFLALARELSAGKSEGSGSGSDGLEIV